MAEVTRRFLAASGPVTREDFARWLGRRLLVTIEPFAGPLPARARRAAEAEAERLAAFAGGELELTWADA
jgi:hypothetical protein